MTRFSPLTALVVALGVAVLPSPSISAQDATDLGGRWVLDRQASQFPAEVGFDVDWLAGAGEATTSNSGGGRRGSGGAQANPYRMAPETEDDAHRLQRLTAEVRQPAEHVTIVDTPGAVTITYEHEPARSFSPDGREAVLQLGDVPVKVTARRDQDRLEVVYDVEPGRQLRYVFTRADNPRELLVDAQFLDHGKGDTIRRVYRPMTPAEILQADAPPPPPVTAPKAAPAGPAGPAAPAGPAGFVPAAGDAGEGGKVDSSPDAGLRGLTSLNVAIDGLGSDSAACGLNQDDLQSAVEKRLSAAGLTVVTRTTEDTSLDVNVVTVHPSPGSCISRYDVSLGTEAKARLSYQSGQQVLADVSLLREGGLVGGSPAMHAADVLKGVLGDVDEFITRIRNAGR